MKLDIAPGSLNCFYFTLQNIWMIIDLTSFSKPQSNPSVQFLTTEHLKQNLIEQLQMNAEITKVLAFIEEKRKKRLMDKKPSYSCLGEKASPQKQRIKIFLTVFHTLNTLPAHLQTKFQPIPSKLSSREKEILNYISHGFSSKQIAEELCIGQTTVITHRKNLLLKFNAKNTAELIRRAVELKQLIL